MKKLLIIICSLLFISSFTGCSKTFSDPRTYFQKPSATEDYKQLLPKAEQGDAVSQFKLGTIYYKGEGIRKDYSEALKWFTKAAKQGHAMAQFHLGLMYEKGHIAIPQNNVNAYIWYGFAAEQGLEDAKNNITTVEFLMTTTEIARAKKQAAEMRKKMTGEKTINPLEE